MSVRRIFVEKKDGFNAESVSLCADVKSQLNITDLNSVRILVRYDAEGLTDLQWEEAVRSVFSEPMADAVYNELTAGFDRVLVREFLPGQYDQRSDSAAQCIQLLTGGERVRVRAATVYGFTGSISEAEFTALKKYLINPVESREGSLKKPDSLELKTTPPGFPRILSDFCSFNREQMTFFHAETGLAMSVEDALFVASYFKSEKRAPTLTELRIIDTYWSDHCRHTTFAAHLEDIRIGQAENKNGEVPTGAQCIQEAFELYTQGRHEVYGESKKDKPICLMDIATLGGKWLAKDGLVSDLDSSDEVNACSIKVTADIDGKQEEWLVMFKNETHNHPTEIEPFGGAATCLGGAIRDPLSGRSYVYQSMRVTGSADPRKPFSQTRAGKLPQRVITKSAAAGFSSYGNQIGLATGQVAELYHPGWEAKRLETGAVVGAAAAKNVFRRSPIPGDVIILLGGRTGRDGCGGATGSSKAHTAQSLETCGAEVQKGNPLTERKIQRLFRNGNVSRLIARCNDFGAGGVCVAVGELADSLDINLDAIPLKYEGLDCTELAISESQERMAVVLDSESAETFIKAAQAENLEAAVIARVTDSGRMRMIWKGKTVADLSRQFLNTNGVASRAQAHVPPPPANLFETATVQKSLQEELTERFSSLSWASQRGLSERFDASIGAATVLMPFGGRFQATPVQVMAAKLPVLDGETTTGTLMSHGYDPFLAEKSPFHGAIYAVCESLLRLACAGADVTKARLTFQEYFPRLGNNAERWGMPLAALLGAFTAQKKLGIPAIGGKDSMSGSFENLDVPPALISFALVPSDVRHIISGEFKGRSHKIIYVRLTRNSENIPDFTLFLKNCAALKDGIISGRILAAYTCAEGGIAKAVSLMAFGNRIGAQLDVKTIAAFMHKSEKNALFAYEPASFLAEITAQADEKLIFAGTDYCVAGSTGGDALCACGETIPLSLLFTAYENGLEGVFPSKSGEKPQNIQNKLFTARNTAKPRIRSAKPRVLIPVFPGTNCEYDTARAFEKAGAEARILVVRNTAPHDIEETVRALQKEVASAHIIAIPGGFSGGDEPDGSGKFIATVFRSPRLADETAKLLKERDGLIIGICNGFQALIKLGLVPYGTIVPMKENAPTLTFNAIGRHQSRIVRTKTVSVLSPWFSGLEAGKIISVPVSHGEGRFVCAQDEYEKLLAAGQIATQYADENGNPAWKNEDNPAGSYQAVEGITSPDGRVLGKMGHNERWTANTFKNVPGSYDSKIFESGVRYFL